jgi:predicted transcriptional regulator
MRIRRSNLDICATILGSIAEGGRALAKTQIMYQANISFSQLQNYLSLLLKLDLIKELKQEDRVTYEITEKGKLLLQSYRKVKELMTVTTK